MKKYYHYNRHYIWTCPYFKWDALNEIHCVGVKVKFNSKEDCTIYAKQYCAGNWDKCEIAFNLLQEDMNGESS